jgi:hypothetical protein
LWAEFALHPPRGYTASNIFGTGTYFVPAFIALVCVGFFFMRITRDTSAIFLAGLSFLLVILIHNSMLADLRYYLPLLIILIAVAVLPATWAARNLLAGNRIVAALAIFALLAAACLGFPSRSGYPTLGIDRSQAWDALYLTNPPRRSWQFIAQENFGKLFGGQPGIVLSDIDPVYLNALLPASFVAAPIDGKHNYCWSKMWRYDRLEALALIRQGLDRSLPVYALFVSTEKMTTEQTRLPVLPGYEWTILNNSSRIGVLQLTQARSGSHVESYLSPVER